MEKNLNPPEEIAKLNEKQSYSKALCLNGFWYIQDLKSQLRPVTSSRLKSAKPPDAMVSMIFFAALGLLIIAGEIRFRLSQSQIEADRPKI